MTNIRNISVFIVPFCVLCYCIVSLQLFIILFYFLFCFGYNFDIKTTVGKKKEKLKGKQKSFLLFFLLFEGKQNIKKKIEFGIAMECFL